VVDVRPVVPVGCPVPLDTDPGYRMSRWARLGMTLTVTAAIVVAAVVLVGRSGTGRTGYVTVEPGDTLWSVASRTAPDRDPHDVVAELIRLNGLGSGAVHAGEVLRIAVG
jgi:LysM repeat protein